MAELLSYGELGRLNFLLSPPPMYSFPDEAWALPWALGFLPHHQNLHESHVPTEQSLAGNSLARFGVTTPYKRQNSTPTQQSLAGILTLWKAAVPTAPSTLRNKCLLLNASTQSCLPAATGVWYIQPYIPF